MRSPPVLTRFLLILIHVTVCAELAFSAFYLDRSVSPGRSLAGAGERDRGATVCGQYRLPLLPRFRHRRKRADTKELFRHRLARLPVCIEPRERGLHCSWGRCFRGDFRRSYGLPLRALSGRQGKVRPRFSFTGYVSVLRWSAAVMLTFLPPSAITCRHQRLPMVTGYPPGSGKHREYCKLSVWCLLRCP